MNNRRAGTIIDTKLHLRFDEVRILAQAYPMLIKQAPPLSEGIIRYPVDELLWKKANTGGGGHRVD